jgi:tRNA pseudouridine55 synthase
VYSAIKINGKEAYKRARAGETVVMPSRQVRIYENVLRAYGYPVVELSTKVSSGTYIRTLAQDLGELVETGAYLSALKRTEVGLYRLDGAAVLSDVTAENVRGYLRQI